MNNTAVGSTQNTNTKASTRNRICDKDGRLSAYGLGCGYNENRVIPGTELVVSLWKEDGVYMVRRSDWQAVRERLGTAETVWWSGIRIKQARKVLTALHQGRTIESALAKVGYPVN